MSCLLNTTSIVYCILYLFSDLQMDEEHGILTIAVLCITIFSVLVIAVLYVLKKSSITCKYSIGHLIKYDVRVIFLNNTPINEIFWSQSLLLNIWFSAIKKTKPAKSALIPFKQMKTD